MFAGSIFDIILLHDSISVSLSCLKFVLFVACNYYYLFPFIQNYSILREDTDIKNWYYCRFASLCKQHLQATRRWLWIIWYWGL